MKALIAAFSFNEQKWISTGELSTIPRIICSVPTDLLLIDDGSTDRTVEIATGQGIEILALPHNHGKADAMKLAFWYGITQGYELVVTLDCDGQHDISDITRVFSLLLQGTDVVLGVRFHPDSPQNGTPDDRVRLNRVIAQAVEVLTGCSYHDVLCGFRGFSQSALKEILPKMQSHGHGAELETVFLLSTHLRHLSVRQLPVAATYCGSADLNELYRQDPADRLTQRATMHLQQLREFSAIHDTHDTDVFADAKQYSDRWETLAGGEYCAPSRLDWI